MKRQQHIVPNMLTAAEAAAVANVSLRTLLDWLDDELLPHVRLDAEGVRVAPRTNCVGRWPISASWAGRCASCARWASIPSS